GADRYFARLRGAIDRPPRDAAFAVAGDTVSIVPDQPGRGVDVARTARAILAAATSASDRTAAIVVEETRAKRTTADVKAMGIDRLLASYTTPYSGTPQRIGNLQLAVAALDGTLLAPGETFSFNGVVGERTAERGYQTAPVIIAGEYEEDVGGGVSQVATTVFNAAWEAGLQITERNPHALYITRYQLGRDATVNYPNLDLKFVNDTKKWVLVKGAYGSIGIEVSLYGGESRRVESIPRELEETGPGPVRRVPDPTLEQGKTVVEEEGTKSSRVSVDRIVYSADGTELRRETWRTSYRGEYRIVRVGTKVPEPPKPKPAPEKKPSDEKKPPPKDETKTPTTTTPTTPTR
ncbi:MAG: VanW family protein, partial [Actinobacteria bacterium]|nr:VanW family protein [Actinomycetota bacterium]